MMQLRTWLGFAKPELWHGASFEPIRAAAQKLEREVRKSGVIIRFCDDAERFKDIVDRADALNEINGPKWRPLLAAHADPVARHLTSENFFAFVGTEIGKRAPLHLTATGCTYPRATIRDLLNSQHLFCDYPDTDAPFVAVTVEGDDPALDDPGGYTHGGTFWIAKPKRDGVLSGIASKLFVLVAWLRFGRTIFGTVVTGSGHEKTFDAPRVIGRAICDGFDTTITLYRAADIEAAAERIATPPPT